MDHVHESGMPMPQVPNYVNPRTRVTAIIAVMVTFTTLMVPVLLTRLHVRLRLKGLHVDDGIVVFAALLSIASTTLACYATRYGAGYHTIDFKPEWIATYTKLGLAGIVLFTVAVALPKISACFTYLMLFPSKSNRIFCQAMIFFLVCWAISTVLVTILQCRPAKSQWDPRFKQEWCVNAAVFNITTAVLNSASDFLVYLWPARFLWHVQLPVKQRVELILVFVVGCGACVAGIVRMWYIHRAFHGTELFYNGAAVWIASSVETNIGIIFTCIHAIKPFVIRNVASVSGFFVTPRISTAMSRRKSAGGTGSMQPPAVTHSLSTRREKLLSQADIEKGMTSSQTHHTWEEFQYKSSTDTFRREVSITGGKKSKRHRSLY